MLESLLLITELLRIQVLYGYACSWSQYINRTTLATRYFGYQNSIRSNTIWQIKEKISQGLQHEKAGCFPGW